LSDRTGDKNLSTLGELSSLQISALNVVANGIVITDSVGTVVWANRAFSEMTGYSLEEAAGKNPRALLKSGKHDSSFYKKMWDTIIAGNDWRGEVINRRKDGSLYDEEMTITPLRTGGTRITHFVAVKQDITERKRMEEAMASSEKRFRELANLLPQTVYETDLNGNIIFGNRASFDMFGIDENDFKSGLNVLRFIAAEDKERAKADIARAMGSGKTSGGMQYRMVRKDGSTFSGLEYGSVMFANGKPAGLRGLIVDISAQKEAEQIAVGLKNKFEAIFDNVRDAIFLGNRSRFFDCNRSAEELFRGGREKIFNSTAADMSPEFQPDGSSSRKKASEKIEAALSGQSQFFEWQHKRFDGTLFIAEVSLDRFDLEGEDVILAVVRDVTERKGLEGQLLQSQRLESLGRLTSGIAHDFNNVLGGILGFSSLGLRKADEHTDLHTYLDRINALAKRAAVTTNQLLAFSRNQILRPKNLNLNNLIRDTLEFLSRIIKENIRVEFKPDTTLKMIHADESQIEQVLLNLAVNANDAMPNGGTLTFETANLFLDGSGDGARQNLPPGSYAKLLVADTGEGMDAAVLERIFEPFFTTKDFGKGTGLGLSVVDGIIKQHRGSVVAHSQMGKGTTFEILLPATDIKEEEALQADKDAVVRGDSTEKILIVEDNEELRELLTDTLEENGYTVVQAAEGGEGLRLYDLEKKDIAMIISDMLMPKVGGRQLYEKVKTDNPNMKFLFVSGYAEGIETDRSLIGDDVDFLQKPFEIKEFSIKVRSILDRKP
jgi:PAS domain S-box-containing protein